MSGGIRRGELGRILSNYVRIALGFAIGLVLVRLLIGIGEQAFGIYAVVAVGAGISIMLKELLRLAIVPGLSHAWTVVVQSPEWKGTGNGPAPGLQGAQNTQARAGSESALSSARGAFARLYGAAFVLAGALALLGAGLFTALHAGLGALSIDPGWLDAARWFVICRALQMVMTVTLLPMHAMLMSSQRQVQANMLLIGERVAELSGLLVAIAWVGYGAGVTGGAAGMEGTAVLTAFAIASTASLALLYLAFAIWILRIDRAFRPRPGLAVRAALGEFGAKIGWSAAIVLAMNLYVRYDVFFVNLAFGVAGTVAFGISVQLNGYIAQLTQGLVSGLDAVFARLHATRGGAHIDLGAVTADRLRLVRLSTRLQGVMVFSALGFLLVAAPDLIRVWLGGVLEDPDRTIAPAAAAAQVMALGMGVRSLTSGWMAMMAGEGRIDAYAPWLLPAALANPLLVWLVAAIWPGTGIVGVAWVFAALQIVAHGVVVMAIATRTLGLPLAGMLDPLAVPLGLAGLATLAAWLATAGLAGAADRLGVAVAIFAAAGLAMLALTLRDELRPAS